MSEKDLSELSVKTLSSYADKAKHAVRKIKGVEDMSNREKINAYFSQFAKTEKGITKAKNKIANKNAKPNTAAPVSPSRSELETKLKVLKTEFDPAYARSDDYSEYSKHHAKAQRIADIENQLKKLKENEELEEAVTFTAKKDGNEFQVLSRKAGREFVIQSKQKNGTWKTHDAVGSNSRAVHWIESGRFNDPKYHNNESSDGANMENVDEMDFGNIAKTLGKYGKGVKDEPQKKTQRSFLNPEFTTTGHKEAKSSTGRVFTKVFADTDDAEKSAKVTVKTDTEPKRGRGRPVGSAKSNQTYKPWSDEAKASLKAKLAARRAAKTTNEATELEESKNGNFKVGDVVHVAYHDIAGKTNHGTANVDKATDGFVHVVHPTIPGLKMKFRQTVGDKQHTSEVNTIPGSRAGGYIITKHKTNESVESLQEEDWDDILEGYTFDDVTEFMLEEEFEELDELSKKTLGSYISKAALSATQNAREGMTNSKAKWDYKNYADTAKKNEFNSSSRILDKQAEEYGDKAEKNNKKTLNRVVGITRASSKIQRNESETVQKTKMDIYVESISGNMFINK